MNTEDMTSHAEIWGAIRALQRQYYDLEQKHERLKAAHKQLLHQVTGARAEPVRPRTVIDSEHRDAWLDSLSQQGLGISPTKYVSIREKMKHEQDSDSSPPADAE